MKKRMCKLKVYGHFYCAARALQRCSPLAAPQRGENTIGKLNRWVILKSNFEVSGFVFSCIETKSCKKILVGKLSPRSTQCTPLHRSLISIFSSKFNFAFSKCSPNFRICSCFFTKSIIFRRKFHGNLPELFSNRSSSRIREILNHFQNSMNFISEQVCFNCTSRNL